VGQPPRAFRARRREGPDAGPTGTGCSVSTDGDLYARQNKRTKHEADGRCVDEAMVHCTVAVYTCVNDYLVIDLDAYSWLSRIKSSLAE